MKEKSEPSKVLRVSTAIYQQSLPSVKIAKIAKDDAAAHQKHRESLSPKKNAQIAKDNAAAHQKHCMSLRPKKKA